MVKESVTNCNLYGIKKGRFVIFTESVETAEKQLKNLINKASRLFADVKGFVLNHKTGTRITAASAVFIASLVIALGASGVSLGVKVLYNGSESGVIENENDFIDAKQMAVSSVSGAEECDFAFENFKLQKVLTLKSRMSSVGEVARIILDKNADIVSATEIKVNGKRVACVDGMDVKAYIAERLSVYDVEGAVNTHRFSENVEIDGCYCLSSDLSDKSELDKIIDSLDVETTSVVVTRESLPYSTVTEKTSMQYVGFSSVVTEGEAGVAVKTTNIVSLNGMPISEKEVSTAVVSEPVDEVVLVGTKQLPSSSSVKKSGFVFPLPKGSYQISSYYGDRRNHKGVDLAADKGTSIYAVKSGTVTFSGGNGNYGYCVIVDHGNGLKTLYAHANKLLVNKGDKVEAGQIIATVGNTGRSTGNHLHFEIIVNGSNVNPAAYIGLK